MRELAGQAVGRRRVGQEARRGERAGRQAGGRGREREARRRLATQARGQERAPAAFISIPPVLATTTTFPWPPRR